MSKTKTINKIHIGRRSKIKENLPNNWQQLDINNFSIPKGKNIFMFGGNTTTNTLTANGNAKAIESLIEDEQLEKTNIFTFYYDDEPFNNKGILLKEYEENANHIYEKIFKPILFDKKGYIKDLKGIEQEFDNMVFTAHCGGSAFANIIIENLYNTLAENFRPNIAKFLINKIQYFAYAPNRLPNHNLNSLIIAPFADNSSYTWSDTLNLADSQKIDTDYPKGSIKRLLKAKQQCRFQEVSSDEFQETRAFMFKTGNTTFIIPSQMNPNIRIGDHSIESIYKNHILNNDTDYSTTAKLINTASKLYMREFLNNSIIDIKYLFSKISTLLEKNKPIRKRLLASCDLPSKID